MSWPTNPYESPATSQPAVNYPPGQSPAPMILASISVAFGALGFLGACCCAFLPLPPLAIVFGVIALTQKPDRTAKNLAIAGIVCGGLGLLFWIAMVMLGIANATLNNPQFRQGKF